jgi:phage tail-like protein
VAAVGARRDPGTSRRFYIELDGLQEAEFSECSGLQVEMDVFEYQEGGRNDYVHRLPGQVKVSNVTLKRGIVSSDKLWDWFSKTVSGRIDRKNLDVVLCDEKGQERQRWSFQETYPVKWVGPGLKASDNAIAVEALELAHRGMKLQ